MTDIQDKYRERWQDRRKKSYNWKKLIIMVLILIVLFVLIDRLNKIGNLQEIPDAEFMEPETTEQLDETPVAPAEGEIP